MKDGYYTVSDIRDLTGLNRRQIHEYKEIIKPINNKKVNCNSNDVWYRNYGLYDDYALEQFKIVGMLLELGQKPSEIKSRMQAPDFDSIKTLEDIYLLLLEKKGKIENLITAVEQLILVGIKNLGVKELKGGNLNDFGKYMKEYMETDFIKKVEEKAVNLPNSIIQEIFDPFSEILSSNKRVESEKGINVAEQFENAIRNIFTNYTPYMLLLYVKTFELDGLSARYINDYIGRPDAAEKFSELLCYYFLIKYKNSLNEKYLELQDKRPFDEVLQNNRETFLEIAKFYFSNPIYNFNTYKTEEEMIEEMIFIMSEEL